MCVAVPKFCWPYENRIPCTKDVLDAFLSEMSNSISQDGIPLGYVKLIVKSIVPYLTHVFNAIFMTSNFPFWKYSKIPYPQTYFILLLQTNVIIVRLVYCLHYLKHLKFWWKNKLTNTYLDISCYHIFNLVERKTTSVILRITDDIRKYMYNKLASILLDFAKAFYSINHRLMCQKLIKSKFGFDDFSVGLI